jgi:GT2 family glycosyltransferase
MTTKKIWNEVGGWNEEFDKMTLKMGEDTDFSIKIQKLGYEVVQVGNYTLTGNKHLPFSGNFPIIHSSNGSWMNK